MAELDFTALNKLAYRDFETPEEQAQKDALIDKGFTVEADADNPFIQAAQRDTETPPASPSTELSPASENAVQRNTEPHSARSGASDYKAIYRAVYEFHKRNNPPQAEPEYWDKVALDMVETANAYDNNPLLNELILAVYNELEREYKALS